MVFLLIVAVCVGLFLWSRRWRNDSADVNASESDSFLSEIAASKLKRDSSQAASAEALEDKLRKKYSGDLSIKERLIQFAKKQELDKALIELWNEVKYYPSRPSSVSNLLSVTDVKGSKSGSELSDDGERQVIEFGLDGRRYKIACTTKRKTDMMGESHYTAEIFLTEDDFEVFGVACAIEEGKWVDRMKSFAIRKFIKSGGWAEMLLRAGEMIKARQDEFRIKMKYHDAEKIKENFQE